MHADWVTYTRKSNGRKAVPRQKALIAGMIGKQDGTVLAEFSDRDSTAFAKPGAARPKRDDFDRMTAFLSARRGLRIGAYHADRLLRNSEDTATLIRVCAANGHLIETHTGGTYDLSTANGRRRLRDDASAAEFEVDHNTERVLDAKDERAALGLWGGGRRPFGWEPDPHPVGADGRPVLDEDGKPAKGYLRLVPAEATALAEAHADVLAGVSLGEIARRWNAAGLTGTSGGRWTAIEVRRVLRRPRNAGLREHRGQVAGRAAWEPIVPEDTWRAVCAVLADPARKLTPGPERVHLLSGIARCAGCGSGLVCTATGAGRGRRRRVYACKRHLEGGAHVARDAEALDTWIEVLVKARLSRPDARLLLRPDTAGEIARLHAGRAELDGLMRASNDLRRQGLLTPAEFAAERREHMERAAALDELAAAAARSDVLARAVADPAGAWESAALGGKREVIAALMTVTVHPQRLGRPAGWRKGEPYFDPETVRVEWVRRLPSDG